MESRAHRLTAAPTGRSGRPRADRPAATARRVVVDARVVGVSNPQSGVCHLDTLVFDASAEDGAYPLAKVPLGDQRRLPDLPPLPALLRVRGELAEGRGVQLVLPDGSTVTAAGPVPRAPKRRRYRLKRR